MGDGKAKILFYNGWGSLTMGYFNNFDNEFLNKYEKKIKKLKKL
jgi:hypothetical protein